MNLMEICKNLWIIVLIFLGVTLLISFFQTFIGEMLKPYKIKKAKKELEENLKFIDENYPEIKKFMDSFTEGKDETLRKNHIMKLLDVYEQLKDSNYSNEYKIEFNEVINEMIEYLNETEEDNK